jgi:hypothetical protein
MAKGAFLPLGSAALVAVESYRCPGSGFLGIGTSLSGRERDTQRMWFIARISNCQHLETLASPSEQRHLSNHSDHNRQRPPAAAPPSNEKSGPIA